MLLPCFSGGASQPWQDRSSWSASSHESWGRKIEMSTISIEITDMDVKIQNNWILIWNFVSWFTITIITAPKSLGKAS